MKKERASQGKSWRTPTWFLFVAFMAMALLTGPGFVQNALADIKSDLEAKIDNEAMGFEEAAYDITKERLEAGESYEDILAALVAAAEIIAEERGWNVAEAVAAVRAGVEKEALDAGIVKPSTSLTSTSTTTSTSSTTTTTTTTTSKETTSVSPTTTTSSSTTTTVSPTTTTSEETTSVSPTTTTTSTTSTVSPTTTTSSTTSTVSPTTTTSSSTSTTTTSTETTVSPSS